MSIPKRLIRRRKRRSQRSDLTNPCDIWKEESNWKFNMDCSIKRNIFRKREMSNESDNSTERSNHSEIPNETQRLVGDAVYIAEESTCDSAKESELDDFNDTPSSSQNGIDVDKSWDYYQTIYSECDGDSHLVEPDNIKDWEANIDDDDVILITDRTSDLSLTMAAKKISMLTSGYETSPEADPTICTKILLCVLDFTDTYQSEMDSKIKKIVVQIEDGTSFLFKSWISKLSEYILMAQMHLDLIYEIARKDPCSVSITNIPLFYNLNAIATKWRDLKNRCAKTQLRIIDIELKSFDNYETIEDLKRVIDCLKELMIVLSDIELRSATCYDYDSGTLCAEIELQKMTSINMKDVKVGELEVLLSSLACLTKSRCEVAIAIEDRSCTDAERIIIKSREYIIALNESKERLCDTAESTCQVRMISAINEELFSWTKIYDDVCYVSQDESMINKHEDRILYLRAYIIIAVLMVTLILLYYMSPINTYQLTNPTYVRHMSHKLSYHLRPH